RMLHKCPLLAYPLLSGCRWRYKSRFPGGRLSPLATVRSPSFKATILLPLLFECSHLGLDPLRRNGTTGADLIHTLLDSVAHVSFPDFIALFQKAETFTNDLAGGFVVANRHFLADKF